MEDNNPSTEHDAEIAAEEADRQRKAEPAPVLSKEEFIKWRSPRTVEGNPTRLDNPLWHWLVRTRWSAYQANKIFQGPSPFDAGPMWCFDRFGKSETRLPGGRVVHIGGEHEDHYDPDFFIYNDVTTIVGDGGITIHGYPPSVFPPTDFHTATTVDHSIIVIGNLGYSEHRIVGSTPVFRVTIDTLGIDRVDTVGEAPGVDPQALGRPGGRRKRHSCARRSDLAWRRVEHDREHRLLVAGYREGSVDQTNGPGLAAVDDAACRP